MARPWQPDRRPAPPAARDAAGARTHALGVLQRLASGGGPDQDAEGPPEVTAAELLDERRQALVCLAALIASGASAATCGWAVRRAAATGVSREDVVAVLVAIAPVLGEARIVEAAPRVAMAIGHDVAAAFEAPAPAPAFPPA
ncbi:MAG: hypothetical protein QOE86_1255 [Solirubrobacteraceae bacterium]|jgi:alkylhydroperoxidase/carboxymuconolactone decarboxylase family protein YurZ|nr:hypothetical protein [Solirubrobacteraceae bacterium]